MVKILNFFRRKNFGVSFYITSFSSPKSFGLPASRNFYSFRKLNRVLPEFFFDDLLVFLNEKINKSLGATVLSNPSLFGAGLRRYLYRRIRVLKFNRSYRGVRHSQRLPVRYQRSKTNARTQKSRR